MIAMTSRTLLASASLALAVLATGCTSGAAPATTAGAGGSAGGSAAAAGSGHAKEQPGWRLVNASSRSAHTAPLPVQTGWGPTRAEIGQARRMVGGMSLAERAGQVIVAEYEGSAPPSTFVNNVHLGGVVVFAGNVVDAAQVRRSNQQLRHDVRAAGRRWPLLIGVDQEGGTVERVAAGVTHFPAFMTAGASGRPPLAKAAFAASGAELADLGFNLDFAPDADVTIGEADPTIGSRSAGSHASQVVPYVDAARRGLASTGLIPVLKHFPGHGSVTANSHLTLPVQQRSLRTLMGHDLLPFRREIAAGASAVMVGHLDVRAVDPGMPSSVSRKVVTGLLRHRLGFRGLAVTDSMAMRGVSERFGSAGSAVRALRAGEDVILMPFSPREARDGIVRAVRDRRLSASRLDQAATRMIALLLHQRDQGIRSKPAGSSDAVSQQLSAAGITSVAGACSGPLVGKKVSVSGSPAVVPLFKRLAVANGLRLGAKGTSVSLLAPGDPLGATDVAVAVDTPYLLGRVPARVAKLATYGETPGAMQALIDVLQGRTTAPGQLPVAVPGVSRTGC